MSNDARKSRVPTYRLHNQSGQAIVTLTDGLATLHSHRYLENNGQGHTYPLRES